MPYDLTQAQTEAVTATRTRPIYLVEIWHSGSRELYSSNGRIVYNGELYERGGANIQGIQDSFTASVTLPWTPERVAEVQAGTWRQQPCIIRYIPEAPGDRDTFATADAITLIDGAIRSSSFAGDRIVCDIEHINTSSRYSPAHTINDVTAFVIPPGTKIEWEGEILILEAGD